MTGGGSAERPRPVVLLIIDGFGVGPDPAVDAIATARMPAWRQLLATWPHSLLDASGPAVGLPVGQMGNSEVGHLNIGAGRPVLQDLPRIDAAIADGSFFVNDALMAGARRAAEMGRPLHLVSLIGPGGVHAHDRHLVAIAELAQREGVQELAIHALLDGRDTPPRSAGPFVTDLEARLTAVHPGSRIATITGRYYGMDRDQRWERVESFYRAMVQGVGAYAETATAALQAAYARDENDEFVIPTVCGEPAPVDDGDVIIHCNFRADRARELVHALVDGDGFAGFDRGDRPRDLHVVTLSEYEEGLPVSVAFPPVVVTSLAEMTSEHGWRQCHIAETEKYAHVTYFLNGGVEQAWPGEDRVLIPSPRVATYDLEPAMSAVAITDALVAAIGSGTYDLIVANFANPDMVGHTGVWAATVAACELLDGCISRVVDAVLTVDAASVAEGGPGALLAITADHGNADVMRDAAGAVVTAHSLSLVPFLLAGTAARGLRMRDGVLSDVTPTLLGFLGTPVAPGMTGCSVAVRSTASVTPP